MPRAFEDVESRKCSRTVASHTDEEDVDEEIVALPPQNKKKRRKRERAKAQSKTQHEDTEMIDINDEDESASLEGPQPHQLKFYKGETREVIELALFFLRLYLLNVNAYPSADELITWSSNAFTAACKSYYGSRYKRTWLIDPNYVSF